MKINLMIIFMTVCCTVCGQKYWNEKTSLTPFRVPLVSDKSKIELIDLDKDGDPDVLKTTIMDGIPIMWIDDDDDMAWTDTEGDTDSDCLLIDKNRDGKFAGPWDLCIDWVDINNDGKADMQFIVENGDPDRRRSFDWESNLMLIIDDDQEGVFNHVDWNTLLMRPWKHSGHSNFYTDYNGNITFTKMSASSFRINDFRYSWENPFLFWDFDGDGLSEMAMRLLDIPHFRSDKDSDVHFKNLPEHIDVKYSEIINYVAITYDLDNDNGQGNQFDFDFSLCFQGKGYNYSDQVNKYKNLRGLPDADTLLYDASWRKISELIFPNRNTAYDLTFDRGEWSSCWFVFDEDDDCNRWERVEFYQPRDLFKVGMNAGGLDTNPQADPVGDRGEFDEDFSGKGNLYISPFDGRIHLLGAEWGAWRIDQEAKYFQGYGGLYDMEKRARISGIPSSWATVKYTDSDNNGFFDLIEYDLDGDTVFEESISLKALGIDDRSAVYEVKDMKYPDYQNLFKKATDDMWMQAQAAIITAGKYKLDTSWYSIWKNPRTEFEKYQYAYWLKFYIYKDLCDYALQNKNPNLKKQLDKAYYSGAWNL